MKQASSYIQAGKLATIILLASMCPGFANSEDTGVDKLVLTFYYPWYMTVEHSGYCTWNFGGWKYEERDDQCAQNKNSPHMPAGGLYDSLDPETVKRHLDESRRAGIDGWIFSWWGIEHETDSLEFVLSVIEEHDPGFKVAVYYEMIQGCRGWICTETGRKSRINAVVKDFKYLEEKHFSHPSYLKVDGRPVAFIYIRAMLGGMTDWLAIMRRFEKEGMDYYLSADAGFTWLQPFVAIGFDQVHFYNQLYELLAWSPGLLKYGGFVRGARLYGRDAAVTVIPGYDERLVPGRPGMVLERKDGETYRKVWENAIAANPDWILITSFNEWYEGSEIEPSEEYGDKYLEMTAEYAARFKGKGDR
jgi:hypothetical protein